MAFWSVVPTGTRETAFANWRSDLRGVESGFVGDGFVDLERPHRVAADAATDAAAETADTTVEIGRLTREEAGDTADFPPS